MPGIATMTDFEKGGSVEETTGTRRRDTVVLWTIQGVLAALFLFAGGMKLAMPVAALTQGTSLPGWFLKFIGVAEVAGAVGLILPGLSRMRPKLTPLAATGLLAVMIGATAETILEGQGWVAAIPFLTGVLCATVAYGRLTVAPHAERSPVSR